MGKRQFKPGNMLYPVPAVMVSVADKEGNANIITVAWAGTGYSMFPGLNCLFPIKFLQLPPLTAAAPS